MIEFENVTKRYGRRRRVVALRDVSLEVPAGSVWAVVGPNGAGKSTLLALALGFIRPTRGAVLLGGMPPRYHLRDNGAGYLSERFSLPPEWRVRDALRGLARLAGGRAGDADRAAGRFGLEPHLGRRIGELSRGLLQRVGLAQALLVPRDLVVLDEPTEGLDPVWRIRLRDIVADLRDEGRTVIIASHDLGEVERVADRAILLEGGAVREILDTRSGDPPSSWRITLAAPFDRAAEVFPAAAMEPDGTVFTVALPGPAELSERVAALVALGGLVVAVEPLRQPLEERVREALGDDA
ncbi:MAG TPA: ABC transporter ATP-binding protein [Longimicrobiales bacterium]|nr:ABC transporter ATP-binding protein [Longimicrobiales bacterium]